MVMQMWAFINTPTLVETHTMRLWAFYDLDHTDPNCGLAMLMARRAELSSRR